MSEDLELLDDEPLVVEIERPVCACPLVKDACSCLKEETRWE